MSGERGGKVVGVVGRDEMGERGSPEAERADESAAGKRNCHNERGNSGKRPNCQ